MEKKYKLTISPPLQQGQQNNSVYKFELFYEVNKTFKTQHICFIL